MSLITAKTRFPGCRTSIYGTAPVFLSHQPSQQTGCCWMQHAGCIPSLNLQELLWKLWKRSAPEASCSREFLAHHPKLHPPACPHKSRLMPPNSLPGRSSNHGPCPPSRHMVHHHIPASPSPFQAEAGHGAKPFQIPSRSLSLLLVRGSHLQVGAQSSGFPVPIQTLSTCRWACELALTCFCRLPRAFLAGTKTPSLKSMSFLCC